MNSILFWYLVSVAFSFVALLAGYKLTEGFVTVRSLIISIAHSVIPFWNILVVIVMIIMNSYVYLSNSTLLDKKVF